MAKTKPKKTRVSKTFTDYDKWKTTSLAVNRLKLDPENPRLATSITRPPQIKLIEELIEHEGVLDLARNIAQQGYFPNELLVVYRDGSDTIVVEGNRRLAALKLLLNPDLAPAKSEKRVRTLAEMCRSKINKVPVIIAPSREAAVPMIIARHDGEAVKKWTPVMQARFVQGLIDQGLSIADVAAQTGLEVSHVLRHFRNSKLSDVIQSLELPKEIREIVANPRQFPFTTLERLIDYSAVNKALMLETSEEEGFTTELEREPFLAALTYIVTDIANGTVNSRSHNKAAQVTAYIKEMWQNLGKKKKTSADKIPASSFIDPSKPTKTTAPKESKPKAKAPKPRNTLIPKRFVVDVENHRIQAIAVELKSLPLDRYPNAISVMFRSLLEMALSKYLNDTGALRVMKAQMAAANKAKSSAKPADWTPSFTQQLKHVASSEDVPIPSEARKAITHFISESKNSLTLERLHAFTHNAYIPPSAEQLRGFWENLLPLTTVILQNEEGTSK